LVCACNIFAKDWLSECKQTKAPSQEQAGKQPNAIAIDQENELEHFNFSKDKGVALKSEHDGHRSTDNESTRPWSQIKEYKTSKEKQEKVRKSKKNKEK
jgi:hypothetical protein